MKKLTLLVMLFATIASGCSNHQEKVTERYDSMHFVRQGVDKLISVSFQRIIQIR